MSKFKKVFIVLGIFLFVILLFLFKMSGLKLFLTHEDFLFKQSINQMFLGGYSCLNIIGNFEMGLDLTKESIDYNYDYDDSTGITFHYKEGLDLTLNHKESGFDSVTVEYLVGIKEGSELTFEDCIKYIPASSFGVDVSERLDDIKDSLVEYGEVTLYNNSNKDNEFKVLADDNLEFVDGIQTFRLQYTLEEV